MKEEHARLLMEKFVYYLRQHRLYTSQGGGRLSPDGEEISNLLTLTTILYSWLKQANVIVSPLLEHDKQLDE